MLTKKQVLETIGAIPEEKFTHIDTIIEELIFIEKMEKGLAAINKGQVLSEEEMDKEIEQW